jgi:type II secretory pathway pseudopilin PulG
MGDEFFASGVVEVNASDQPRRDARTRRSRWARLANVVVCMLLLILIAVPVWSSTSDRLRKVSRQEIVAAMRLQQAQGYALDAISNSVRLQAGVFLQVAAWARASATANPPLLIGHEDYFAAMLEVTGLNAGGAPEFIKKPYEFREDYLIDYRTENVIERVVDGKVPLAALNVKAGWPDGPDAPPSYSYEDTSSHPTLEVTHQRLNSYRILDFGDVIVYDDIQGVTGRATSGVLGLIFALLGKARAIQTRFIMSSDGVQISRTTAQKLIKVTQTITIYPDGTVLKGLPDDRPELSQLEDRLRRPLGLTYVPIDIGPIPGTRETPR